VRCKEILSKLLEGLADPAYSQKVFENPPRVYRMILYQINEKICHHVLHDKSSIKLYS
jgi:hypothetical protein